MEFRQLEVFVAVADRKSFSKAGEYLFLSQSTVSTHIRNLEKDLGVELFHRTTKTLTLTAKGEKFLLYARKLMETRDIALEALDHTPETILALGASTIPAAYLLPDYLRQFQEKNPSVRYRIRRGDSAEILEMVADGAVDLGFVGKECSREVFDSYQICQDELVVIFPNTEEYRQREKEGLNALLHSPLIIREKGSGTQNASDRVLDSLGIFQKELNIICQTNDIQMIKSLVALGSGISICSRFAVREE